MPDDAESIPEDPPKPIRLGKLVRPNDYRRALKRICAAVLDGRLEPKRAGTAGYLLSTALKSLTDEAAPRVDIGPGLTVILQQAQKVGTVIEHEAAADHSAIGLPAPE